LRDVRTAPNPRFAILRHARRIWAIGAVHGRAAELGRLHAWLDTRVWRGDRVVYCGNLLGRGPDVGGTIREMLLFRRAVIARPGFEAEDVVLLRGAQEEMLHRLLQIQFARGPAAAEQALAWMAKEGVGATLSAWGHTIEEGLRRARSGPVELARWTGAIRRAIREAPGHDPLLASLRRAAFTVPEDLAGAAPGALFVAAGVDPSRPLEGQGDSFWWDHAGFAALAGADAPWNGFRRIVRGHDRAGGGFAETPLAVTLGEEPGQVLAGLFAPDGTLIEVIGSDSA
jgi:hypothetical protein